MRVYLHIRTPEGLILDPEGEEHAGLDSARAEAIACIHEIMDDIWRHKLTDGRQFEITDASGQVVLVVPFSEADEL